MENIAINLTGGGARGSYQAGVLLALGEVLKDKDLLGKNNPFTIWSGTSAGAINATFCASRSQDLQKTTEELAKLWQELTPEQVYHTDFVSLSSNSARWIRDLTFGPLMERKLANSLLDTSPLLKLLEKKIAYDKIQECIDEEYIESLICSAYCYNNSKTVSFLQTKKEVSWDRYHRISQPAQITAQHVLASCSIPMLFPPTSIENRVFGDGGFRNTTPMSPAIQLGAKKILMIGVRSLPDHSQLTESETNPGLAKIAGSILNALFFDTLDVDLERINHINEMVTAINKDIKTDRSDYTYIDYKVVRPTEDVAKMAEQKSHHGFPRMIKFLLGGLGTKEDTSDLASYILFDPSFTKELLDLGYHDLMSQRKEIEEWLYTPSQA